MKLVWSVIACVVVVALGTTAYFTWFAEQELAVTYEFTDVQRGDIESVVVATGELQPVNEVIVGSEISGQISEMMVDFNDSVEAGEILARLDPRTLEARLSQREADVESAKASIVSREAERERAQSNLRQATRQYDRNQDLRKQGHVSESQLDNDKNQLESATSSLAIAEAQIVTARSGLVQAEAALAQAELDLERTFIRSPVSGTVISRNVEIGQTVAASLQAPELFIIANDLHQMQVEASVDEADIGQIQDGMQCRFTVDAYPEREFNGRIQQVRKAPIEQANVVTYKVIITARNEDLALLPGMTANVEIVLGQRSDVLKIANGALRYQPREGVTYVSADSGGSGGARSAGFGARPGVGEQGGSGFRPPSGGAGGGSQQMAALQEALDLTDEQSEQIDEIFQRMRQNMQASFASGGGFAGGGGGPDPGFRDRMRRMRDQMSKDIESVLTTEQRAEYRRMTSGRSQQRRETVFVMNEEGVQVEKNVVVGLQDDSAVEVISGLDEGEEVVVRARRVVS